MYSHQGVCVCVGGGWGKFVNVTDSEKSWVLMKKKLNYFYFSRNSVIT